MGVVAAIICGVVSGVLFLLFGYMPWVAAVSAVPLVFVFRFGHRAFKSGGNTDLMVLLAGLMVMAAIVVPKFAHR